MMETIIMCWMMLLMIMLLEGNSCVKTPLTISYVRRVSTVCFPRKDALGEKGRGSVLGNAVCGGYHAPTVSILRRTKAGSRHYRADKYFIARATLKAAFRRRAKEGLRPRCTAVPVVLTCVRATGSSAEPRPFAEVIGKMNAVTEPISTVEYSTKPVGARGRIATETDTVTRLRLASLKPGTLANVATRHRYGPTVVSRVPRLKAT